MTHKTSALRRVVGAVIAGGSIYAVVAAAGGLGDTFDTLGDVQYPWLAAGIAFALLRMMLYGAQVQRLTSHTQIPLRVAYALAWVVYGFGAITPAAPAEGLAYATATLRRHGTSGRDTTIILGFSEWFAQRAFYAIAAANLVLVIALGHLPVDNEWPFVAAAAFVVAALALTARLARRPAIAARTAIILAALRAHGRPRPSEEESRTAGIEWQAAALSVVGSPSRRVRTAALSVFAVIADGLTLWAMCRATGSHLTIDVVLLAAATGTVVSWIPLLPGGLGVVEVAVPAVLHACGTPFTSALAATVAYRSAGTVIPAVIGAVIALLLRRVDAEQSYV